MEDFITIIERGLHVINRDGMKAESWQALRDEREEEEERWEPAELRLAGAGSPVIRNMRQWKPTNELKSVLDCVGGVETKCRTGWPLSCCPPAASRPCFASPPHGKHCSTVQPLPESHCH